MRIVVEVREDAFRTPKTPQQVADEMRQAAAAFWVARGDVAPEAVNYIAAPSQPEREETLKDLLLSMPDVGEDADFERPVDYGRPTVEFD
ncbi:uncharacterized protein SOCE26_100900 [Sorangium cellulosum]|uniref:Uncharacterized protein n=1 Tax=Sorangium cellulosum TaxID=56 RepID=A0A2L0FAQ5_SORCE|nr:hypothetical protein [Sorangium cellulosum]AUX48552.1 uncharacterized protein SOCE26_100900 [Sorangium cellulosum]